MELDGDRLLGLGVFTLGASRPWGYGPLLAGMVAYGRPLVSRKESGRIGHGLCFSLVSVCVAVFLQLIPLPAPWLSMITPAMTIAVHGGSPAARPLSVDPSATGLALTFLVALCLFFVGVVNTMGQGGARRLATPVGTRYARALVVSLRRARLEWHYRPRFAVPPDSTPHGRSREEHTPVGCDDVGLDHGLSLCSRGAVAPRSDEPDARHSSPLPWSWPWLWSRPSLARASWGLPSQSRRWAFVRRRSPAARTRISRRKSTYCVAGCRNRGHGVQPIVGASARLVVKSPGRVPIWRQVTAIARIFRSPDLAQHVSTHCVGLPNSGT